MADAPDLACSLDTSAVATDRLRQHLADELATILSRFDCTVGTIHLLDPTSGMLELRAQVGLPDALQAFVQTVPVGKGMAGLAAERAEPVQVCNLQTDQSGVARPRAKQTQMEGSIAVPIIVDGAVRGVVGIAKPTSYVFRPDEVEQLLGIATELGKGKLMA